MSLQQYDLAPQNLAHCLSSASPGKNLILTIQDGGRSTRLRHPFCTVIKYCHFLIFMMAAVRHLEILKFIFITAAHFRDTFCVIR